VAGLVTTSDRAASLDEAFAGRAPMRALWFADLADKAADTPRVAGLPGVPWGALAALLRPVERWVERSVERGAR